MATHVWAIEDGRLVVYEGNYSDMLEEKELRSQREVERRAGKPQRNEAPKKSQKEAIRSGKQERERQTALAALEERISSLEARLATLNEDMTSAGQAGEAQRVWELSRDYQEAEEELARAFAAWEQAAG